MSQLTDLLFMWPSTHATIPTGWTRETACDTKFIKGWGAENPGVTGGATTHSHTGEAHTHTVNGTHGHSVAYTAVNNAAVFGSGASVDSITGNPHGHATSTITTISNGSAVSTVAYPTSTDNNAPIHKKLIWIKGGSGAVFSVNMVGLLDSATIPSGWYHADGNNSTDDLRNVFPRGADGSSGNSNLSTVGDSTHTHALNHSHSTSHGHTGTSGNDDNHNNQNNQGGTGGNKTNAHTHTVTLNATTVTTDTYSATLTSAVIEPPFKKLLPIQRKGGSTVFKGLIGGYLGTEASIPKGWIAYTAMQNLYLKFANTVGEIGDTTQAGVTTSLTHAHSASNSHTHTESAVHTHTGSTDSQGGQAPSGGTTSIAAHSHSLTSVGNNNATMNWSASTMSAESVSNEPEYIRMLFVKLDKVISGGGALALLSMMT